MKKVKRDWANLESLPLSLVLDNLEERIDHIWFSAVCKNWQSTANLNHQNHQFKTNTLPMLVLDTSDYWAETETFIENKTWWLYGIPNKTCYPLLQLNQLCPPNNPELRLCGSSHGWFALVDDSTSIITLVNPFKDTPHIILPPLNVAHKVTLSADPLKSPNDYMIVAIYGSDDYIAFIRRGQLFWTYIDTSNSSFIDVIFCKGLLFALNLHHKIVSFNIDCSNDHLDKKIITSNVVLEESMDYYPLKGKYLVKSLKEELWMVRLCKDHAFREWYDVFKLEPDAKSKKLEQMVKLKCLGDNILFLGAGDSISVSASYFSKSLQRNSIYFAQYLKIYDVKSRKYVTYHSPANWKSNFWILPNFQWN
jgi:hypothetical protein